MGPAAAHASVIELTLQRIDSTIEEMHFKYKFTMPKFKRGRRVSAYVTFAEMSQDRELVLGGCR